MTSCGKYSESKDQPSQVHLVVHGHNIMAEYVRQPGRVANPARVQLNREN